MRWQKRSQELWEHVTTHQRVTPYPETKPSAVCTQVDGSRAPAGKDPTEGLVSKHPEESLRIYQG